MGASPRWLLLGIAARAGCAAALAASEGYSGDRKLLDDDWMLRAHGIQCDAGPLVAADARGKRCWCTEPQALLRERNKPSRRSMHSKRFFRRREYLPTILSALRVAASPGAYAEPMIGHRVTPPATGSRASPAPLTSLLLPPIGQTSLENVARPNLATWRPRKSRHSWPASRSFPKSALEQHYPGRWPARVEAVLKNGCTETNLILDARGDPARSRRF